MAEILKQSNNAPVPVEVQVIILYALANGFMEHLKPGEVASYQAGFLARLRAEKPELIQELLQKKDLTEKIKEGLNEQLTAYGSGAI